MNELRYSICVVHHGDAAVTRKCLESLRAADPAPVERVVVWNDPAAQPGRTFADLIAQFHWVAPGENLGYAGGANAGVRAAFARREVEAVWLLNNDVEVEARTPGALLAALARDPRLALAGPRIYEGVSTRIWHDGGEFEWPAGKLAAPMIRDEVGERATGFVSGCAPLIRRAAFEDVGGFDERYFLTYEDADFCARLRARGWTLAQVPGAHVRHLGSASLERDRALARYYRLRNRILFAREHTPDRPATDRALRRLRRHARWDAVRWYLSGRAREARATLAALRDADHARFGRWEGQR